MKIQFLCGSLEPGRDGVGDYTRRLAGELIRQGNDVSIIALNDRFVKEITDLEQGFEGENIPVLRLPSILKSNIRFSAAKQYIDQFDPEYLSLQYVPYSFQKKGLPFGLGKQLAEIGKGRKWHIMFHELFIGIEQGASIKARIVGFAQQLIISDLLEKIGPQVIHTQISLYKKKLERLSDIKVQLLPLFGNIPIFTSTLSINNSYLCITFFGGLQAGVPILEFVDWIKRNQERIKKIIHLHFVGNNGKELSDWEDILTERNIEYTVHGSQNIEYISKLFHESAIGVVTTPYLLVRKSGSAAAMLEHGLPVLCVSRDWIPRSDIGGLEDDSIFKWNSDTHLEMLLNIQSSPVGISLVSKLFMDSIRRIN